MARGQDWEGRSIHNSQTLHADYFRVTVHNGFFVARMAHCARASGMRNGVETLADDIFDLCISLDLQTRESLVTDLERLQRLRLPESARTLESCDCDLYVCAIGQPIGVDYGRNQPQSRRTQW